MKIMKQLRKSSLTPDSWQIGIFLIIASLLWLGPMQLIHNRGQLNLVMIHFTRVAVDEDKSVALFEFRNEDDSWNSSSWAQVEYEIGRLISRTNPTVYVTVLHRYGQLLARSPLSAEQLTSQVALQSAYAVSPTNPLIALDVAWLYWSKGEVDHAVTVLREIGSGSYFWNLGGKNMVLRQWKKAERYYEWSQIVVPSNDDALAMAHFAHGIQFEQSSQWVEATNEYKEVVLLDPMFAKGWTALGKALLNTNEDVNLVPAQQALEHALNDDPFWSRYYLGLVLLRLNKTTDAISYFEEASRFDTNDNSLGNVYLWLGRAYKKQEELTKARDAFARSVELNHSSDGVRELQNIAEK